MQGCFASMLCILLDSQPAVALQHCSSMCEASADRTGGSGAPSKRAPNEAGVWLPMDRAAKKDWSWVDWMRFLFYRQAFALLTHS